jgi:hypothetical protein
MEQSLITEEVRGLVGRMGPPAEVIISRRQLAHALETFFGSTAGVERLSEGDEVPGVVLIALQGDADGVAFPSLLPNSLLISNEMTLERPLRLGERLIARSRLADVTERLGGRFGYGLYVRSETVFADGAGPVASVAQTLMYYDPAAGDVGAPE